jgi:hypothetical protein
MPQALEWTQHALMVPVTSPDRGGSSGGVFATWQGVTAVTFMLSGIENPDRHRFVDEHLRAAWDTAATLQASLGGTGGSFLTVFLRPTVFGAVRSVGRTGYLEIRRGPLAQDYDRDTHLSSTEREITRAADNPHSKLHSAVSERTSSQLGDLTATCEPNRHGREECCFARRLLRNSGTVRGG